MEAVYSDIIPRAHEYGALVLVLAVFCLGAASGLVFLIKYVLNTMTTVINNNTEAWKEAISEIRRTNR